LSTAALFDRLRDMLESSGMPYMLTGSYASAVHGTPRATQDIDIVIGPSQTQLMSLLQQLPETSYYVSHEAALDALARRGQFNVIDFATGWKVDFIIVKAREFSREELKRRRVIELDGVPLYVASAEDLLIAKLEWAKLGASARQLEDAAGIVRMQAEQLDRTYVERWVAELGLDQQWAQVLGQTS
jgi:hypothetical protein